jgi:hypothetical protein
MGWCYHRSVDFDLAMKTVWKFKAYHPTESSTGRNEYIVEAPTRELAKEHLTKLGFFDIDFTGHAVVYVANELN